MEGVVGPGAKHNQVLGAVVVAPTLVVHNLSRSKPPPKPLSRDDMMDIAQAWPEKGRCPRRHAQPEVACAGASAAAPGQEGPQAAARARRRSAVPQPDSVQQRVHLASAAAAAGSTF